MKHLILVAICLSSFGAYSQGVIDGFFKGKKKGAVALSASFETASTYWGGQNEINIERNMPNAGIFATYGLAKGFDVVANIPFVNLSPQDASLYLKLRAFNYAFGSSWQMHIGVAGGVSTPMTDYNTESSTAIGQQATVFDGRAFLQIHFNQQFFVHFQSGYAYALDPVPSYVPFSAKFGIARDKWYADVWFDLRDAESGKDYGLQRGDTRFACSFRQLEVDYKRVGGTFYKPFSSKFGMSIGGSYTISGRNTFQATSVNLGAIWNIDRNKSGE